MLYSADGGGEGAWGETDKRKGEVLMKKVVLFFVCSLFLVTVAFAGEKAGTVKEAQQMVKKAVAFLKANGKDKAFAAINNKSGPFVDRDLYVVVYDMKGNCLAHGFNSALIGKDLSENKDSDGKPYGKQRLEMAKGKPAFWLDYKYTNPATKKIEPKSMYHEVTNDMIVGCGIYKPQKL
jgi:cytochrome c